MSKLIGLLNKISSHSTGDKVHPGLKEAVATSQTHARSRRRLGIVVLMSLISVLIGCGLLYYFQLRGPVKPLHTPVAENRQPMPAIPTQPTLNPISSAKTPPVAATSTPPPPTTPVIAEPAQAKATAPAAPPHRPRKIAKPQTASPAPVPKAAHLAATVKEGRAEPVKSVAAENNTPDTTKDTANRDAFLYTAKSLEAKGDYGQALKYYRKALELDSGNYRLLNNIAGLSIRVGFLDEAVIAAEHALKLRKDYLPALINLGIARVAQGREADAVKCFSRAIKVEPTNRTAIYNLALLYERSSNMPEAGTLYRKLSGLGDPQGRLGLARIMEKENNPAEARRLYRELLAIPEGSEQIKDFARERLAQIGG